MHEKLGNLKASNIVLIGMPGSGKSTIGKRLASHYNLGFVDGDNLIENAANSSVQAIIDKWGLRRFQQIEQQVLCDLNPKDCVISTGGSAIYSASAMHHLGNIGTRLYLKISPQSLIRRVNNAATRGLYKYPAHSLMRLFSERQSLYPQYADITYENNQPFTALRAYQLYALLEGV